jgi:hypothetical protein
VHVTASEEEPVVLEPETKKKRVRGFVKRHPKTSIAIGVVLTLFVIAGITGDPDTETVAIQDASSSSWNGNAPRADLSPGSVDPKATVEKICEPNFASSAGEPAAKTRKSVFSAYGISEKEAQAKYTLARVVPVSLGGDKSATNLWPASNTDTAALDQREGLGVHLRELVCAQQVDLTAAQRALQGSFESANATYGSMALTTTTTALAITTTSTTAAPVTTVPATTPTTTATTRPKTSTTKASSSSSGNGYTNVDGNHVPSPVAAPSAPAGATAQCGDGTYSFSQNHSGTCSHHGGVAHWL